MPLDFSASSLEALRYCEPLVRSFGANLHLVHVAAPDAPVAGLAGMPIVVSERISTNRIKADLDRAVTKSAAKFEQATVHVERGEPYEQICRLARDLQIDLIVIATRGQTGVKHLLLGSTAERVVRYSPCPVLVVRSRHASKNRHPAKTPSRIRKILVPIDFSDCSLRGFDYARALSSKLGCKMILMHSIAPAYYVTNDEYARYDFPDLIRRCQITANKKLRELADRARNLEVKIDVPPTFGHAGLQICCRAEQLGVDLIVTSTHGRTGFKHVLIGSTAEYVVRHAVCPVLIVPSHDRPALKSNGATS